MKNGSSTDKLRMQERALKAPEQNFASEKKKTVDVQTDENVKAQTNKNLKTFSHTSIQQQISATVQPSQQQTSESGLSSLFSILPSASDTYPTDEPPPLKLKKKMSEDQD